jgi:hypothetical protein
MLRALCEEVHKTGPVKTPAKSLFLKNRQYASHANTIPKYNRKRFYITEKSRLAATAPSAQSPCLPLNQAMPDEIPITDERR